MKNMQDIIELARELELDVKPFTGELACAFIGEWDAGKSSLVNNLIGIKLLPVKMAETTKTVVRLSKSNDGEPHAVIKASEIEAHEYTGIAAIEAVQQSSCDLLRIEFKSPSLEIPPSVCFIDTPGLNSQNQVISSKAETVNADVIVFVLQGIGASLNQTQIQFIQQILLAKSDINDFFFAATFSELLNDEQKDQIRTHFKANHIPIDRLFFVSNKNMIGIPELKQSLYSYINLKQSSLLEQRQIRYKKEICEALRKKIMTERAALSLWKDSNSEKRELLLVGLREAKEKERRKKIELRTKSHSRLHEALRSLREAMESIEKSMELLIERSSSDQLQAKGYLQKELEVMLQDQFVPVVQSQLEKLLNDIQGDIGETDNSCREMLEALHLPIPGYTSSFPKVNAEHILPLATIGCIMVMGWFSVPTLVLGYLTLKASELGLTRYADQTGLLDRALTGIKDWASSGYKQTIKMALSRKLVDYVNSISDYYREQVENAIEIAIGKIRYTEEIEETLKKLRDESALISKEILIDKAEKALSSLA
jgi:hypothetical protein